MIIKKSNIIIILISICTIYLLYTYYENIFITYKEGLNECPENCGLTEDNVVKSHAGAIGGGLISCGKMQLEPNGQFFQMCPLKCATSSLITQKSDHKSHCRRDLDCKKCPHIKVYDNNYEYALLYGYGQSAETSAHRSIGFSSLGSEWRTRGCEDSNNGWCKSLNRCVKNNEVCPQELKNINKYGCNASDGYTWCKSRKMCIDQSNPIGCPKDHSFKDLKCGSDSNNGLRWCESEKRCISISESCPIGEKQYESCNDTNSICTDLDTKMKLLNVN